MIINTKVKLTQEHQNEIEWFQEAYGAMNASNMRNWLKVRGFNDCLTARFAHINLTKILAANETMIAYIKSEANPLGGRLYSVWQVSR
jgi:hypothetical protein